MSKPRSPNLSEILVWDCDRPPPADSGAALILWRKYDDASLPGAISILREVEEQADALRQRYLAWVYELGESRVDGIRVVDRLELRPGFSYWWMTPIVEKCNYGKSPWIDDAIKLMAFERWAGSRKAARVRLVSANTTLAKCLRRWCAGMGMLFEWQVETVSSSKPPLLHRIYKSLPEPMRAVAWLCRYVVDRWPLRNVGVEEWKSTSAQVTFVSYLFNLVPSSFSEKHFASRYWTELPGVLRSEGCETNWLHLYVKDTALPDSVSAARLLRAFGRHSQGTQVHLALDSFISVGVIVRTLLDWIRMAFAARRLEVLETTTSSGQIDIWPLFAVEWRNSIAGTAAMNSLLFLNLLEAAMDALPRQQTGIYLQENQGWEYGLQYAWRAAGHGRLIGCPHSTVRYWDLRYFFDPRTYTPGRNTLPMPDRVAVNGMAMRAAYQEGKYPENGLVDVEALRYLYLAAYDVDIKHCEDHLGPRLIVLCDYTSYHTARQMHLLEAAASLFPMGTSIVVKPHPACPVRSEDYPDLVMTVTNDSIANLLGRCDVAFTSATTSAAVDAYCAGVPVVSILDGGCLNQSPLRGHEEVQFVSTPQELAEAVVRAAHGGGNAGRGQAFFFLDENLPRWKKLCSGQVFS